MDKPAVPRRAFYQALGQLLKKQRILLGWTQANLAFEAGTYAPHISLIENGKMEPSTRIVWNMATALCIPHGALLRQAAGIATESID